MQPDIHCTKCGGLGFTYDDSQKTKIITTTVMVKDNTGIIDIDSQYENNPLIKVYDNSGKEYENAQKTGSYIILNTSDVLYKGLYITVVMIEEIEKQLLLAECDSLGYGYYRISGLRVGKKNIDGVYYTAPCDIEHIGTITDAAGICYTAKELRQDCFYIEPTTEVVDGVTTEIPITNPVTVSDVSYIPPFTFALLNQNLTKSDENIMQELNGDAVVSFPYNFDVANDDIITVLSGTYTEKKVLPKSSNSLFDVLPAYFVEEVVSCIGNDREYIPGTDFILLGTNRIKWLCEDYPEDGDPFSITYKVFPTYKVVKDIPQIRTSENQRMPKKAVVKLYSTYGEKRGVNRQ